MTRPTPADLVLVCLRRWAYGYSPTFGVVESAGPGPLSANFTPFI